MATPKNEMPSADFTRDLVAGNLNAATKAAGAEAGKLLMVPVDQLRRLEGFNVRVKTPDYLEHKNEIAKSIRANGFYPNKPLGGYVAKEDGKDIFYVTDGYTRLDAVESLNDPEFGDGGEKIEKVPFVVKPTGQNLEDLTIALVQDNEGRPLSVFERAIVTARLKSYGMDDAVIATRLGVTPRYVSYLLLLAGAPAKVRKLLIDGKVSATEAVKQLRKEGNKAADKLTKAAEKAAAEGKKKATGKDVRKAAGEPTRKEEKAAKTNAKAAPAAVPVAPAGKTVETLSFVFTAGAIHETDEIAMIARVDGADWWNYVDDTKANVFIEKNIEVSMTIISDAEESPATEGNDDDEFATGDAAAPGTEADVTALGDPAPGEPDTGDL